MIFYVLTGNRSVLINRMKYCVKNILLLCCHWIKLQLGGAASGGAVVSYHNHKRGSERCMKWRKMADHVQVSRGFMFLHQTFHVHARK